MDDSLVTELRRRKTLRFDDPTDPRALEEGDIAKVVGTVRPAEEPWRAPFTGRECVAFTTRAMGRDDELVFRASEVERAHDFWIDAEGGSVWVRPSGWVRYLIAGTFVDRDHEGAWRCYEEFADRYGAHYRETLGHFANGLRMFEAAVVVGQRVAVVGRVGEPWFPPAGAERRGGYRTRTRAPSLEPPADGRLWISGYDAHLP